MVKARKIASADIRVLGVNANTAARISARVRLMGAEGLEVAVLKSAEPHIGFGSRTSLMLACVEAAAVLEEIAYSPHDVQVLSGRGGASGIGINSYFIGVLIGDAGRASRGIDSFLPSSAAAAGYDLPEVIYHLAWPREWPVAVLTLRGVTGSSGMNEVEFFARETPMGRSDSAMSALVLHFELPGCVLNRDFNGLRECLIWLRSAGFKAREVAAQSASAHLMASLDSYPDVAVAMSSFGPSVVVIMDGEVDLGELFSNCATDDEWVLLTGGVCDSGRIVVAD